MFRLQLRGLLGDSTDCDAVTFIVEAAGQGKKCSEANIGGVRVHEADRMTTAHMCQ